MTDPTQHCQRPWWKRPPVWLLALVLLGALGYLVVKQTEGPAPMPYGAFLDQVEAGNVASATFNGTEIDGRFKQPLSSGLATGTSRRDSFRSRVPDFGDPALIPELRKEHVAIDVRSPSQWVSLLARLPWPMLVFVALILVVALVRIVRGPKAGSGPDLPMRPGGGIIGLVSGLFGKKREGDE
jgi:ATP-dependent Zn protease